MESICVRLDSALAKRIEEDMKEFNYSTKTEFVREAIRDKLKDNGREKEWSALLSLKGSLKGKIPEMTEAQWLEKRKQAGEKMLEAYEKKFSLNQK